MQVKARKIHKEKVIKEELHLYLIATFKIQASHSLSLTLMANLIQGTKREYKKNKKKYINKLV